MRCRGLHGFANCACLEGFPFPALLSVAPYCVPGGIRVVSRGAAAVVRRQVQWHGPATFGATIRCHRFLGVAEGCKTGIVKPIPLLAVARRCCVLLPGWCQKWCQRPRRIAVMRRAPRRQGADRFLPNPYPGSQAREHRATTLPGATQVRSRAPCAPHNEAEPTGFGTLP